jgi:hypothetical protein
LKLKKNEYVRKVSSGFKYFLLIFAIQLGQSLKVFGLDAELNSASNADIFEGVIRQKKGMRVRVKACG